MKSTSVRWVSKKPTVEAALAIVFLFGVTPLRADPPDPWQRGIASAIVPGLGQASNGNYGEAALHFGLFAVSVYGVVHYKDKSDYLNADKRYDEGNNREFINQTTLRFDYASRLATDLALYSGYAAYRDARRHDNFGFRTPVPSESLGDLAKAPFSFNYLSRPTTYIPLAIEAAVLYYYKDSKDAYGIYRANDVSERDLHVFNLTANEMTAVGEEAFFRGFLNNEFSHRYGDGWGVVASSTIFGLAHPAVDKLPMPCRRRPQAFISAGCIRKTAIRRAKVWRCITGSTCSLASPRSATVAARRWRASIFHSEFSTLRDSSCRTSRKLTCAGIARRRGTAKVSPWCRKWRNSCGGKLEIACRDFGGATVEVRL